VVDEESGPYETALAWGEVSPGESRLPILAAVAVAIALQLVLPERLAAAPGTRWLIPALEAGLFVVLVFSHPRQIDAEQRRLRAVSIALIALITVANAISLIELIDALLYGSAHLGRSLVYASVPIWITNVIAFGLWYWELDRGGPGARQHLGHRRPDFLFPQMSTPGSDRHWVPGFMDYLYTSFTNATAFSPTDTMPLTQSAKGLMAVQSLASLITVAVVVARAVNILA
jgi:uncharacterized membrane protein